MRPLDRQHSPRQSCGWDAHRGIDRRPSVRPAAMLIALLVMAVGCHGGGSGAATATSAGVRVVMPQGWHTVKPAGDGPVTDPRTLLVVGTNGVIARPSQCQIAAYTVPESGAVVVVVGWHPSSTNVGAQAKPDRRSALEKLNAVRKPTFECFAGRGAVAPVRLHGRVYQVNVMVGDHASNGRVDDALAVARSFSLAR